MACKQMHDYGHGSVPCGQCAPCRVTKKMQKATRLYFESLSYHPDHSHFVTFTYQSEFEPRTPGGHSALCKPDFQKAIKRIRKFLSDYRFDIERIYVIKLTKREKFIRDLTRTQINKFKRNAAYSRIVTARKQLDKLIIRPRIAYAGEYGEKTKRAHFHACIYNVPIEILPDALVVMWSHNKKIQTNQHIDFIKMYAPHTDNIKARIQAPLKDPSVFNRRTMLGIVDIGKITQASSLYTANYLLKFGHERYPDQPPEFIEFPRNPGLGKELLTYLGKLYKQHGVAFMDCNMPHEQQALKRGLLFPFPRSLPKKSAIQTKHDADRFINNAALNQIQRTKLKNAIIESGDFETWKTEFEKGASWALDNTAAKYLVEAMDGTMPQTDQRIKQLIKDETDATIGVKRYFHDEKLRKITDQKITKMLSGIQRNATF